MVVSFIIAVPFSLGAPSWAAAHPCNEQLAHHALLYAGQRQFLDVAGRFLRDGVTNDERPLVVTSKDHITALKRQLGDVAAHVVFADSDAWLQSPTAALSGFRDYLREQLQLGAPAVRVLGEPVWIGRSAAEVRSWTRFESLFNVVFANYPVWVICPYDTSSLPAAVVRDWYVGGVS